MSDRIEIPIEDAMEAIIDYRGKTPTKTSSGVPLATAKIVKGGRIDTPTEFIAEADFDSWMRRGMPKPGDIVITTEAPLGEVAQLDGRRIALAQRLICLRGKPNLLDNDFLKFLLMSTEVQARITSRASGTTVVGIRQSELRRVLLPLPPIDEQRAIAAVLSSLDDKIEQNRRTGRKLEALARAVFKAWFVDFEPVKAKAAGATAFPGMPPETFATLPTRLLNSELGPVPEGWIVEPLSSACTLIGGGTPKRLEQAYWGSDVPWYSVKDAPTEGEVWVFHTDEAITHEGMANSSATLVPKGCTIISARGTVGKLAMVGRPMTFNQSCYGLMPADKTSFSYLYLTVQSVVAQLQQQTHGSVFDTITRATFDGLKIVRPDQAIISAFESVVSPLFDLILAYLLESRKLAELRDYLLPKLLSGQVRVPDVAQARGGARVEN